MADRATIVALVDDLLAKMSAADVDGLAGLYAEDGTVEDPAGTPPHVGREAVREFYSKVAPLQPKATRLGPVTITGNHVAWQFKLELQLGDNPLTVIATEWLELGDDLKIKHMRAIPDLEAAAAEG